MTLKGKKWRKADVHAALARCGYQRISDHSWSQGQEYYVSPHHNSEVRQYLGARYISAWKTYEFTFGFSCASARERLRSMRLDIAAIDSNAFISDEVNFFTVFRVGNAVGQENCLIPSLSLDADDEFLFGLLNKHVLQKYLETVVSPHQVYQILTDNQKPFRWTVNPVMRAAEVIAIGTTLAVDMSALRLQLYGYNCTLIKPYRSPEHWRKTVDQIFMSYERTTSCSGQLK